MRKVSFAAIALILIAGGWWYASPLWTLHVMQSAAVKSDAKELSKYIDYPAVREDLKAQLDQSMPHDCYSPDQCKNVAALLTSIINPVVDALVTPEALEAAFANRKLAAARSGPKLPGAPSEPVIHRNGFNQFTVSEKDPSKGSLVFERAGIGWKLAGMKLPRNPESTAKDD